jgi:GntR family transcriptional regulator
MIILVERASDEPVYEQIARQIRERVVAGKLPVGATLPTVRTLASDLGVNLNTVARAYWLLEEEGFVRIHDRSGAEIVAPSRRPAADRDRLRNELKRLLARMRQAGMGPEELQRFAESAIQSLGNASGK